MPRKKFVHVPFFPKPNSDVQKDDPFESQNIVDPNEPEHFKYGIYFNDGYDYMQHLIDREDFNNKTLDLKDIVKSNKTKSNVFPSHSANKATVLKEFEVQYDNVGNNSLEKIKEIQKNELDEDILNALDSEAELSELEDDFIKLADMKEITNNESDEENLNSLDGKGKLSELNEDFSKLANGVSSKPVIKGDRGIFSQFFGNDIEDDEENDNDSTTNGFYDLNNVKMATNDISETIDFHNTYMDFQNKFRLPETASSTKCSSMSKAFLNAFERDQNYGKAKLDTKIDPNDAFYRNLDRNETEYDGAEIDKAVDKWSYKEPRVSTNAMVTNDKDSKHQPKLIQIKKPEKRVHESMNSTDNSESGDEISELTITNVAQFHVPRQPNETAEERRNRKSILKGAKRARRVEKKVTKLTYKSMK